MSAVAKGLEAARQTFATLWMSSTRSGVEVWDQIEDAFLQAAGGEGTPQQQKREVSMTDRPHTPAWKARLREAAELYAGAAHDDGNAGVTWSQRAIDAHRTFLRILHEGEGE